MRASGFSSCIRLRARRKVDLPQPLGPMMAVTARGGDVERHVFEHGVVAEKDREVAHGQGRRGRRSLVPAGRGGIGWRLAAMAIQHFRLCGWNRSRVRKRTPMLMAQHEQKQDQRAGPGLPVPVVVRRDGVVVNLQRQRGDGFGQLVRPIRLPKAVNSSGAVSPATRASASSTPVTMPLSAVRTTICTMVRHLAMPSASAASR